MAQKKLGKQTIQLQDPPAILSTYSIVGVKEGEGPLKDYFDIVLEDDLWGEENWENSESKIQKQAIQSSISGAKIVPDDIDYLFAGDLLNQISSSSYSARDLQIPFFGLYGACSTMAQSLSLGAMTIDGGYADYVSCATSSHFSTAERQFRYPLEHGNQRPPTSQWTVTGSGAAVLGKSQKGPFITHVTTGKIIDPGLIDANNMGPAMAPSAADTIIQHFKDTGFRPKDYDLIITGDLGELGMEIAQELIEKEGYDISDNFTDCGVKIFDNASQETGLGGSGCGCSATVFAGYVFKEMKSKNLNKVLLVSTGALHSPVVINQGATIPGIAHAVTLSNTR